MTAISLHDFIVPGAAGCVATGTLNPFDVCKTRMQITKNPKIVETLLQMYRGGGVLGLWLPGLTATLFREFALSSVRTGCYPRVRDYFYGAQSQSGTELDAGLRRKIAAGLVTGVFASIVTNPIDVVKIRLMNEPALYSNTIAGLGLVARNEGMGGLFRGIIPNTLRGAAIAAGEIATYDHTKHTLKANFKFEEGIGLHFLSSWITGLVATTVSQPFDVIKTRVMNDHGVSFKGPLDCLLKTVRHESVFALFRGWFPSYCRLGAWSFIFFPIYEQLRSISNLGYL